MPENDTRQSKQNEIHISSLQRLDELYAIHAEDTTIVIPFDKLCMWLEEAELEQEVDDRDATAPEPPVANLKRPNWECDSESDHGTAREISNSSGEEHGSSSKRRKTGDTQRDQDYQPSRPVVFESNSVRLPDRQTRSMSRNRASHIASGHES